MNTDYVEVRILSRAGAQTAFFSTTSGKWPIASIQFSLEKNGGCGRFRMVMKRSGWQGSIAARAIVEVWAKPTGGTLTRYYVGTITRRPAAGNEFTTVTYEAEGIWYEVGNQIISKYYENQDIDDMVADIIGDINADSYLDSSTSEVSLSSPHPLGDLEAELEPASNIIQQLADYQKDVQYGVDQDAKLYFKDVSTANEKHWWVGKQLETFSIEEYSNELINEIYMQPKSLVGGANITLYRKDATSISSYGLHSKLVRANNVSDLGDAWRLAESVLEQNKDPKELVSARGIGFSEFLFPRGNIRITDQDGTEYSLPIQSVQYSMQGAVGFIGTVVLGDRPPLSLDEAVKQLQREMIANSSQSISLSKIGHTRAQEFIQESIIDAEKLGLKNHYLIDMSEERAINTDLSRRYEKRDKFVPGPFQYEEAEIFTFEIPTGQEIDSVRIHFDLDIEGRINFYRDDDLTFFFDDGSEGSPDTDAWRVSTDYQALEQYADATNKELYYRDDSQKADVPSDQNPWFFEGAEPYIFRMVIDPIIEQNTNFSDWVFNWVDSNNYSFFRWRNQSTNFKAEVYRVIAGATTLIGTQQNFTKSTPYGFEVEKLNTSQFKVKVYDETFTTLQYDWGTMTGNNFGSTQRWRVLWDNGWWDATNGTLGRMKWFQVDPGTNKHPFFYISRDGGTTWTLSSILPSSTGHATLNISGQPAGTSLLAKIIFNHPSRLYAMGFSWIND